MTCEIPPNRCEEFLQSTNLTCFVSPPMMFEDEYDQIRSRSIFVPTLYRKSKKRSDLLDSPDNPSPANCQKSDNPIDRYFFHDLIEVGPRAKGFSRCRQTS